MTVVVGLFQEAGAVEHALLLAGTAAVSWRILGLSDGAWKRWQPPERPSGTARAG